MSLYNCDIHQEVKQKTERTFVAMNLLLTF